MHHGEHFSSMHPMHYMQGELDFFDLCEGDRMSLIELKTMARMLGHEHGSIQFYWKLDGSALGSNFRLIKNEPDVIEMCSKVPENRYINVYISTIAVVIDENITDLMNEIDVDNNAVSDNEQHDNVVLENVVNEIENTAIGLDIVASRGNVEFDESDSDSSFLKVIMTCMMMMTFCFLIMLTFILN